MLPCEFPTIMSPVLTVAPAEGPVRVESRKQTVHLQSVTAVYVSGQFGAIQNKQRASSAFSQLRIQWTARYTNNRPE
jgi:hypothetical protein